MSARTFCLPIALLVICLCLASSDEMLLGAGGGSEELFAPRSLDDVLMNANEGRATRGLHGRIVGGRNDELVDGMDMVVSARQYERLYKGVQGREGPKSVATLWTDGVIPYEIREGDFNSSQKEWIQKAMAAWEKVSCVKFRRAKSSDRHKVEIRTGLGCWADLGMRTTGKTQIVNLDPYCFWKGIIEHEFGHTIGLIHEHQRPNRDAYLKVNYYHGKRSLLRSLKKYAEGSDNKLGLPYDYHSVMHYSKTAFSQVRNLETLFTRDPIYTDVIGMTLGPSYLDAKLVSLLYRCADKCRKPPQCGSDCFVTKDCKCFCERDIPKENCRDRGRDCPKKARRGKCYSDAFYMYTFCRKSCGICKSNSSPPRLICTNGHDRCDEWAARGDCKEDPDYMLSNCKVSCGVCQLQDEYFSKVSCTDRASDCQKRAKKGDCDRDPFTMLMECRQSCEFCVEHIGLDPSDKPGCVDRDSICQFRADSGSCQRYYTGMITQCPEHCGTCDKNIKLPADCVDKDPDCEDNAIEGNCEYDTDLRNKRCKKSCNACPGVKVPNDCIDYDLRCPQWARNKECENNRKWMEERCMKSCKVCT